MSYNPAVIKRIIAEALAAEGRGAQTRLANAAGVAVQTVNKWAQQTTTPERVHWPVIEQHFGWEKGYLAKAAGLEDFVARTELDELRELVETMRAELDEMKRGNQPDARP